MHRQIIMSHNLVTEISIKQRCSKISKQVAVHWDLTSKITDCQSISPQMQKLSPCLHPNQKSVWWVGGGYLQGWKLTGSTGIACSRDDISRTEVGSRLGMLLINCGFTESSLIWLLCGQEVPCGICDIPRTMSTHSISSANVAGVGAVGSSSVCGWKTAGTLNVDMPYSFSLSQKLSAASSYPGCVN